MPMRLTQIRRGQSTTEYMLLISVIVIAVVAASYVFIQDFQDGVDTLAHQISYVLDTGHTTTQGG
jgi:uncharacterized protein (UPF0333 family)